ncbi:hypothetical protein TNCV_4711391 [Trichonephila clavipes]|uniref:Uncharacterized protein n=1 Tax=Trichonephila clavipes TaxID=2585209 RepID=A0A8X6V0V8_TRICX|nr:hypothetical protein TNCV_4711391 [Trichonephila clavipes]
MTQSTCDRGSLVINVTDFRRVCHEFEPSAVQKKPMPVIYVGIHTSSGRCGEKIRRESADLGNLLVA